MKKALLLLFSILPATCLYAQNIEVSVQANSSLFHYSGVSTAGSSIIIQAADNKNNYTNNPYGNKDGFSYGFAVQTQYVAKCGFIAGIQAGYDILRSKVDLTSVNQYVTYGAYLFSSIGNYTVNTAAGPPPSGTGASYLQDQFINLSSYIGYRLLIKNIKIDILPGIDKAFNISSYDKGKLTIANDFSYITVLPGANTASTVTVTKGTIYQTDDKRLNAPTDIRLKMGLAASYKRFGVTASYAWGLTNYEKGMAGDAPLNAQSRLIRFGISYRIF